MLHLHCDTFLVLLLIERRIKDKLVRLSEILLRYLSALFRQGFDLSRLRIAPGSPNATNATIKETFPFE